MASEIETLLLEQLKSFKAGQDQIERKLEELAARIGKLETAIADAQPHIHAGDGAHPDRRPDPEAILPSEAEDILIRAGVNSVPGRR
ncbi:hypothetical protein [Methylovirgula sp. 4M-Z18]|uniref:hypothetical protein n=1 Tax=Methylovirgula sp. 4M-Z18 TaxID=2293567 RepID=UPI000E2E93ED|nr:hypothetical protein [Methylovirgula sp. 4M-Z18]